MPDTDFAGWQQRVGLQVDARAAKVLNTTGQAVGRWRTGKRGKDRLAGPLRRLMQILERHPWLIAEIEAELVNRRPPAAS